MWQRLAVTKDDFREFERTFKSKARFLVDENMGPDVSTLLRDFGYNAVFVGDLGLGGHSDETVFAWAWKERRILLTHDSDFLDDHRFPFNRSAGVVVLPGARGNGDLELAIADLLRILAPYGRAHIGAKIEVSADRVWTIRNFSKERGAHLRKRIRLERNGEASEWIP